MTDLHWLPEMPDWRAPEIAERRLGLGQRRRAGQRPDQLRADECSGRNGPPPIVRPTGGDRDEAGAAGGSGISTLTHLLPAIRVAGLRRGIWIETYENGYGQYLQELTDPASALQAFRPTAVLLALDAL